MTQELENLKNNQNISTWGGPREGAGRKPGISQATTIKHQLTDFVSDEELQKLIAKAVKMAHSGNKDMLKYILDQCLGRAVQKINVEQKNPPPGEKKPLTPEEIEDQKLMINYGIQLATERLRRRDSAPHPPSS